MSVSIHAPVWGATPQTIKIFCSRYCFNPRARVGRDFKCALIHSKRFCFNPRARVGRDV